MSAVPTSAGMPVPGPVQETTPTFVGMPKFPYAARSAHVSYTHLDVYKRQLLRRTRVDGGRRRTPPAPRR